MSIEEKKAEILKAAQECFSRFGYEKTTMDDIGKLVGLNKASLYYYYANKESIFNELIFKEALKFLNYLDEKISKISNCEEKITLYFYERFNYFRNTLYMNQISIENVSKFQNLFKNLINDFRLKEIVFIEKILDSCIINNEIKNCDTKKVADILLTISDGIKHKIAMESTDCIINKIDYEKLEKEIKFTFSIIFRGLKK